MGQDGAREQSKGATWAGNKGMAWGTHPPGIRGAGREVWDLGSMWGGGAALRAPNPSCTPYIPPK